MIDNKIEIVNTIKLLLYKENPTVFKNLNFEDDNVFLEPLLFSYLNNNKSNSLPKGILYEIIQGYFLKRGKTTIKYSFNKNDIAYIPQIGYFKRERKTSYDSILRNEDFEIVKEVHPTQEKYFVEVDKGHVVNSNPEYNSVWKDHYQQLFKAIDAIKKHLPEFYNKLRFANKKIYLHDNQKIINFTSVETLGMLYFYVIGNNNLIYFIEELIHQGSHNYLYYIVHNRKDYFKIDVDNAMMRDFTKQEWDYRTIYGAFHGLFTVAQRIINFDILLTNNVFSGREKHELLGRLTDQFSRFRTGLELLDLNKIYTRKGIEFYNNFDLKCETIIKKYEKLKNEFDLSNRDLDFRYQDFCKLNSYENFLAKEKKGIFIFNQIA